MKKEKNLYAESPESEQKPIVYSLRHKRRMNRLFREKVGGDYLPYPEIDTPFERIRSRIVILFEAPGKQRDKQKP